MKLVCNSYTYTDQVATLVQEAAYLQANLSIQEGDAASIPISHIDGEHFKDGITVNFFPTLSRFTKPVIFYLTMSCRCLRHAGCHHGG